MPRPNRKTNAEKMAEYLVSHPKGATVFELYEALGFSSIASAAFDLRGYGIQCYGDRDFRSNKNGPGKHGVYKLYGGKNDLEMLTRFYDNPVFKKALEDYDKPLTLFEYIHEH